MSWVLVDLVLPALSPSPDEFSSSPYARKVRIALHEKSIPFDLVTEVPWNSTTQTPRYNPLEKLPVLFDGDDVNPDNAVYESHFILDWIEYKFPPPKYLGLTPEGKESEVFCEKGTG